MITFLPLPTFEASARVLDDRRLGNQRGEALWIARAVIRGNTHPVVYLWHGHLKALCEYGYAICEEWRRRGKKEDRKEEFYLLDPDVKNEKKWIFPPWMGSHKFHTSHRANLIRKDPKRYRAFGWTETLAFTYFWPSCTHDWRTRADDKEDDYYLSTDKTASTRMAETANASNHSRTTAICQGDSGSSNRLQLNQS